MTNTENLFMLANSEYYTQEWQAICAKYGCDEDSGVSSEDDDTWTCSNPRLDALFDRIAHLSGSNDMRDENWEIAERVAEYLDKNFGGVMPEEGTAEYASVERLRGELRFDKAEESYDWTNGADSEIIPF